MALPCYGYDAVGENTYVTVIAARTAPEAFNWIYAVCATKDAILSLNGGTTDHLHIPAGVYIGPLPVGRHKGAVTAKNAVAGQNYTALYVTIGFDEQG